jgi:hypothetical protein
VDDVVTVGDSNEEKEGAEGLERAEGADGAPEAPPATESPPKEPAWDFATEMKKFVFGLLSKQGEVGLPWQTVLLYLCRDPEKEMRVFKAFNVLGAPMYSTTSTLIKLSLKVCHFSWMKCSSYMCNDKFTYNYGNRDHLSTYAQPFQVILIEKNWADCGAGVQRR